MRSVDIPIHSWPDHDNEAVRHPMMLLLQMTGVVSTPSQRISSRSDVAAAAAIATGRALTGSQR